MKKLGKRLLIVLIIAGVLYGAYMLFVMPAGYTDRGQLASDFFTNMNDADACETYFGTETRSYCSSFVDLFSGETVTVKRTVNSGNNIIATIAVGSTEEEFVVSFVSEEVTGIKRFFNSSYYYIDIIE